MLKKVTIVIPAYNEAKRIYPTLLKIRDYIQKRDIDPEIIVVNDGSTDHTIETVHSLTALFSNLILMNNPTNRGKGYSVRRGMLAATGDWVLFTDADLSTPIEELDRFIALTQDGYDLVMGSRRMNGSQIKTPQPLVRRVIGGIFQKIVAFLMISGFQDTQCGFKLFTRQACHQVFQQQLLDGFAFDVEVLYLARQQGLKIAEIPVEWKNNRDSKVVPIVASFSMLKDLIYIKIYYSIYYARVYERYRLSSTQTGDQFQFGAVNMAPPPHRWGHAKAINKHN